ncbi:cytochrome C biogenesis protein, partial [Xanthomonas vasicola pv. musacearum NCPPB 4384]
LKAAFGVVGAAWVLFGTLRFIWTRRAAKGRKFTAEMLGMVLAHLGVAVFLSGALLVEGLSLQREVALAPGQQVQIGRYALHFDGLEELRGPNYVSDRANLQVFKDDAPVGMLHAEKRRYASGGQTLTEAAIRPGPLGDLYLALGEPLGNQAWAVRVHLKPFVRWIWLGALLMALGGLVTAADRRFRRSPEIQDG